MSSDALKNSVNMKPNSTISEQVRTYQVVVAATREMGIGKDGKLPWRLPSDLKFFKDVTLTTSDPGKRNAVIMGRKTWDSIPMKYRPLPGRLNVVLSRSGSSDMESFDDVVKCGSMDSALKMLAGSPYGFSVEKVFVIGGGQILREALNAPACEAIHLTEIETNIECDTFIPTINDSLFHPWYSSFPLVENGIRYAFTTFVRVKREMVDDCAMLEAQNLSFLPEIIYKRHEAFMYLQLFQEVISTGIVNGNWTKGIISKFGFPMRCNLRKTFPLFTTEGVLWPEIVEELLWIISGSTNANVLRDKGIHVWDKYATRSYLDSIGLQDREEGDLGPFYGFQWRHFGARYMNMHANYSGQGTDQLAEVISKIKNNPEDRRIILSSWNPSDIKAMAIPPQHMFAQFYVANGELSCLVYHRSANLQSSLPVCIASYALLTCMLAHVCDIAPGDLIHVNGNLDLQDTDIGILHEQLERSPNLFPILKIKPEKKNIESFVAADFELLGGHKNPPMKLNIKQFVLPATRSERHEEFMYLELIQDIISTGNVKGDRTGTGTVSKFGCQMCFNLRESFPLLTTKGFVHTDVDRYFKLQRVFWRGIVEELLWFISGSTNAKVLQEKDIHIWDGNASRSYLDSIGLGNREEGDLGPVYGFQWRHFGARYTNMHSDYTGQGIDQLAEVISKIKNRPNDTDIVLTAWNPPCLKEMALPPCHMLAHFLVVNGEVSCLMYQRSADMGLGVPFNIASYSLLTCMVAHVCDLAPGDFVHVIGDTHIYNTHLGPLQEQLKNSPKPFPVLKINPEKKNINSFVAADFELIGYLPHRKIGMKMAV